MLTTFTSYGAVASHRQAALIRGIGAQPGVGETLEARMARIEAVLAGGGVGAAR